MHERCRAQPPIGRGAVLLSFYDQYAYQRRRMRCCATQRIRRNMQSKQTEISNGARGRPGNGGRQDQAQRGHADDAKTTHQY